jgi:hypothetical protein
VRLANYFVFMNTQCRSRRIVVKRSSLQVLNKLNDI